MAKGSTKIRLTAYDDLFETDESRAEAGLSKIRDIPLSEIDEFPDHPFKVNLDEDMEQLVDSLTHDIMLMYTVVTSYQYTSAAHRDTVPSFLNALRRYLASSPKRLWCFYHFCIYAIGF